MNVPWNAPISDRFSSLCARVFSPAAAILESEKTLGTRLRKAAKRKRASPAVCILPMVPCSSSPVARLYLVKNEAPEEEAAISV